MRFRIFFAFAALAVGLANGAKADNLPSGLSERYAALVKSIETVDMKSYSKFYSPDYVSIDPKGTTVKLPEYMAGVNELMKGAKKAVFKLELKKATVKGNVAEVPFDCHGKIFSPKGVVSFHEVGTDTWKKTGKVWMEIKTVDKLFDVAAPKGK